MGINSGAVFPAFLKVEYDESAGGFAKFKSDIAGIDGAMAPARASLKQFGNDIEVISREAVRLASASRNDQFGAASYREAAAASRQRAQAARDMTNALIRAAEAEQDYSASTRLSIAASDAAAREFENAASAAAQQARTMERLEQVMAANPAIARRFADANAALATGMGRTAAANDRLSGSAGLLRAGYFSVGQQFQDIAVQLQSNTRLSTIAAQQGGQLATGLGMIAQGAGGAGGALGRVASFLGGPWGIALGVAIPIAGILYDKLLATGDAGRAAQAGLLAAASGADELSASFDRAAEAKRRFDAIAEIADNRTPGEKQIDTIRAGNKSLALLIVERQRLYNAIVAPPSRSATGAPTFTFSKPNGVDEDGKPQFTSTTLSAGNSAQRAEMKELLKQYNNAISMRQGEAIRAQQVAEATLAKEEKARNKTRKPRVDRSAERLENANESALAKIADINRAWDEQPKLIDRASNSAEDLLSIIKDADERLAKGKLTTAQRDQLEKVKASAREAAATISEGLNRPYNDLIQSQQDALAVQRLTTEGRYEEAEALQQILRLQREGTPVDEARAQAILDNVAALRQAQREQQRLNEIQGYYLNALGEIRGGLREAFASGKPGSIFSSFGRAFKNLSADLTVEKLFGPIFRQMEDQITGAGKVRKANEAFAGQLNDLSTKSTRLGSETDKVTLAFERLRKTLDTINGFQPADVASAPANDNPPDIIVTGRKVRRTPDPFLDQNLPGPIAFFGSFLHRTLEQFFGPSSPIVTKFDGVAKFFANTEGGAALGGLAGTLAFGGGKNTAIGSSIGGALGQKAGEALAKGAFGKALGSLSGALGPLGSIAGGLLGGALGSVLSSTPKGSATIGGGANGGLVITGYSGNSESRKKAAGEGAQSSISSIEKIAEALGGEVTGNGTVSIGIRKGSYRVDTTGQGITKTKKGAIDFGEDAEAAVKFATLDLIKDGVIAGLRASTQRILQQGKDLDSALEKAVDFESVFKRLKAYKDPVGAALDTLDAEFKHLKGIFAEAGADASEYAQLEELYGIERAKAIKEAGEAVTASLRSLLDDLTVGNDARSLRERKGIAQAAYDPLAARVAAGDTTAYDDYAAAARQLLDIERQISGSTKDYFDLLDQITGLTGKAVQDQTNIDSISASRPGLFDTNTSAPVVSAVDQQTQLLAGILNGQFNAVNDNFGVTIRQNEQIIQLLSGTRGTFVDNYVQNF